jgi:hypothetical protein
MVPSDQNAGHETDDKQNDAEDEQITRCDRSARRTLPEAAIEASDSLPLPTGYLPNPLKHTVIRPTLACSPPPDP